MKIEQAKQITSKAIEELSHALEAGHSEKLREYLGAMARFHRYSLHNIMLIASQRPDATHVAGFQTWKRLGRYVKKGAKGILILAPVVLRKETVAENQDREDRKDGLTFPGGLRVRHDRHGRQSIAGIRKVRRRSVRPYREAKGIRFEPCHCNLNTPTQSIPHKDSVRLERSCSYPVSLPLRNSRRWRTKRLTPFCIKENSVAKRPSAFARRKQKPLHL